MEEKADLNLEKGEKIHIITRRTLDNDLRRHFIGEIEKLVEIWRGLRVTLSFLTRKKISISAVKIKEPASLGWQIVAKKEGDRLLFLSLFGRLKTLFVANAILYYYGTAVWLTAAVF